MKIIEEKSVARTWLRAAQMLQGEPGRQIYNLGLEVAASDAVDTGDAQVEVLIDTFLRKFGGYPIQTVAETIFPAGAYRRWKAEGVYERYPEEIHPRLKPHPNFRWGRYAYRLVRHQLPDGQTINPLKILVEKLRTQRKTSNPKKACYELSLVEPTCDLPLYDPAKDSALIMGGPCLMHVSFKLGSENRLYLTALYRSHFYMQRTYGNLLGLTRLQSFVAAEAGLNVGPLACLSTMARLDLGSDNNGRWGVRDIDDLLKSCAAVYETKLGEAGAGRSGKGI